MPCPLCGTNNTPYFSEDKQRTFFQCAHCALVFADKESWPGSKQEKAVYDLHENSLEDEGYNRFLARIVTPLMAQVAPPATILDFGCGPAPALAAQLKTCGYQVSLYDHFYFPEPGVLHQNFDAIVATEVIEHLHKPLTELERLWTLLRPGGWLALMTQRVKNAEAFSNWQYKNDPTHLCFFHKQSFRWLANYLNVSEMFFEGRDMVFMQKP